MVKKLLVINKNELKIIETVVTCAISNKPFIDLYPCNICDIFNCKIMF